MPLQPPHIPRLSQFADLSRDYAREYQRSMTGCGGGCEGQKVIDRYTTKLMERLRLTSPAALAPRRGRR